MEQDVGNPKKQKWIFNETINPGEDEYKKL
jgi:hypothetical protein